MRSFLLLLMCLLIGCGGIEVGTSLGDDYSMSRADRGAIAKISSALEAFDTLTGPAWATKAAELMQSMPEFSEVEDDGLGTVSATLASGASYMIIANRVGNPSATRTSSTRAPGEGQVPGAGLAVVFDGFASDFSHSSTASDVAARLKRAGYTLLGGGVQKPTMPNLMALRSSGQLGFFYYDGHGSRRPDFKTKTYDYVLVTASEIPDLGEDQVDPYYGLFREGMVGYTTLRVADTAGSPPRRAHFYHVTKKFVLSHFRFAPSSVAWPNTCWSSLADQMFHPLGVGLVLGWSERVSDDVANAANASFLTLTADADGSIADWARAKEAMDAERTTFEPITNARLLFMEGPEGSDHIIPEIKSVAILGNGNLELSGSFGPTPQQVIAKRDGQEAPMNIVSWSPTKIVAESNERETSVRVLVHGIKSNLVPLVRWRIEGPDGGPFESDFPIHFYLNYTYWVAGDHPSQKGLLVYADPLDAEPGPRGPISFVADVKNNPNIRYFIFKGYGGEMQFPAEDIWIVSPTGKRTKVASTSEHWASYADGSGVGIRQFDSWSLY